ncbi:MAG: inositol monophosphatase family protein [Chloroflexota bacterium]|nr:inositol monophosphatase family protein [Chloroflexota bacterium]
MIDLQTIRADAEIAALAAGSALMRHYNQPHTFNYKTSDRDFATEGDHAAEAVILKLVRALYPDFAVVSEESGADADVESAAYAWHIDPLDGTMNYAANLPLFCTSIALADQTMQPLVGVVYAPVLDMMFSAARGFGATLNGQPMRVSACETLDRALMVTGFAYDRHSMADNNLRQWETMLMRTRDLRRYGTAALELALVAAGRFDGFWEQQIHSWDCLAGLLLIEEAGGRVSDIDGARSRALWDGADIVASNGTLHEALIAGLRE